MVGWLQVGYFSFGGVRCAVRHRVLGGGEGGREKEKGKLGPKSLSAEEGIQRVRLVLGPLSPFFGPHRIGNEVLWVAVLSAGG